MTVASNAGPLIALAKLGQLGVLNKLYRTVLIPPEVYKEVVINGRRLGAPDAEAVDFLVQLELLMCACSYVARLPCG